MENHPIPQDVTGFQFKLIGEMTIKQFAFLATGSIFAWIFFSTGLPFVPKFSFALISFALGFAFAFIPVEGRSMDVMIGYFVKAFFAPNQYAYQKVGRQLLIATPVQHAQHTTQTPANAAGQKLKKYLSSLPKAPKNKLDEKELVFLQSISALATTPTSQAPRIITIKEETNRQNTTPEENKQTKDEAKETALSQPAPNLPDADNEKTLELSRQLQDVLVQKADLETQLAMLKKKLEDMERSGHPPTASQKKSAGSNAQKTPKSMSPKAPASPEDANLIAGIIKDPRGNILPNILVEVKDKNNNPVRAFKTNALGQFASATPLLNGSYMLIFEDPAGKHQFDVAEIVASGQAIKPLEVISHDERENLRKALFETNNIKT